MRQATGTTATFQIVLIFTFLFAGFLAVAITYNRAYKIKNESLTIMQKYENPEVYIDYINNYLKNNGYSTKGKCSIGEYGIKSLDNIDYDLIDKNEDENKYYYCISYICSNENCRIENNNRIRYQLKVFFKFNLPYLGDLLTFDITGETKTIQLYTREQLFSR